jgi:hypothetical protein
VEAVYKVLNAFRRNYRELIFTLIWAVTFFVFFALAAASYRDQSTTLPGYAFLIPPAFNVQINGVKFQDVINGLAQSYNNNVAKLEESIRSNAHLTFCLNGLSAFMALLGFIAQMGQFRARSRGRP